MKQTLLVASLLLFTCCAYGARPQIFLKPELSKSKIEVPDYPEKGKAELLTLKSYSLSVLKKTYGLSLSEDQAPSQTALTALRDFVHRSNYQFYPENRADSRCAKSDGSCLFKKKKGGVCSFMTYTLLNIYKSLGLKVRKYDVVDGSYKNKEIPPHFLDYRDSHAFIEVFSPELKKWVVEDPTFNIEWVDCRSMKPLSYSELQNSYFTENKQPCPSGGLFRAYDNHSKGPITYPVLNRILDDYLGLPTAILSEKQKALLPLRKVLLDPDNKSQITLEQLEKSFQQCQCSLNSQASSLQCLKCLNKSVPTVAVGNKKAEAFTLQAWLMDGPYIFDRESKSFMKGRFDRVWYKYVLGSTNAHQKKHWFNPFISVNTVVDRNGKLYSLDN